MSGEIRIVLVGKTGVGKSATGNTILGENAFHSEVKATSVTKECAYASRMVNRRQICVVDTPGLYDTKLSNEEVLKEVVKCLRYAAPGPHVFLLVMAIGRFTEEERNTVKMIHSVFGRAVLNHMMVLFTRADDLDEVRFEDYIKDAPELQEVIKACSTNYHTFNNREKTSRTQVDEFMRKIEDMIKQNDNSFYSHHLFTMANELNNAQRTMREKDKIIADLIKEVNALHKKTNKSCSVM